MLGVVKKFDDGRGYGFIVNERGREFFVHYSNIINSGGHKSLKPGDKVEFDGYETDLGFEAKEVRVYE